MSYKCLMPAGMSDDDDEDDDDVFFPLEEKKSTVKEYGSPRKEETKIEKVDDVGEVHVEQRNFEDRLVRAFMMEQLEVVQEYIEQYDVNKFLYTGWTPLLYAASLVQPEIMEYLLTHGANPNKHKDGFTPLMALCNSTKETSEKSFRCLELLLKANADANSTNKRRETALMYACLSHDAKFVSELIKYVQNLDACDSDRKTALSYAVTANKPDIVRILLAHNVNTSLTDVYNNLSAKDIADMKGFTEISTLLNTDEEEVVTSCEASEVMTWRNLFPNLYAKKQEFLDYNISVMLYGMGLEKYGKLFQGMDIKTFLQLTEDDLCHLGIDITVHRDQFLESLDKFHSRKWRIDTFGNIKKTDSYTIYDGVISLTNAKRQISVIASSFQYIKNNLLKAANENIDLSPTKRLAYEEELTKTQKTLKLLKNEIIQVKKLAQEIDKDNNIGIPATWINPKSKTGWTITISITLMVGLYLCKKMHDQRLWNMYNFRIFSALRFRTNFNEYFFK